MGEGEPASRTADRGVAIALFAACAAIYIVSPMSYHTDTVWTVHTALSLLRGQWGDLAGFPLVDPAHYSVLRIDGRSYMRFPIGTSVLIAPVVWLIELLAPDHVAFLERVNPSSAHRNLVSPICAAAVALFYLAARMRFERGVAVAMALVLGFGTGLWSTASRTLWAHGPLILCYAAALLMILRGERRAASVWLAGLPLGFAVIVRPTAAIAAAVLAAYVLWCRPRRAIHFAACFGGVLAPWIAFNVAVHGAPLPPYYLPSRLTGTATFGEALAGHLVSPARGLLVFSPVLLLAVPGCIAAFRAGRDRALAVALAAAVVVHWVAASRFPHWWGGDSFGPRLMVDILPFAVFLAGYALEATCAMARPARRVAATVVGVLVLASVLINAQGAISRSAMGWNLTPAAVDQNPHRLWDWHDPQFLAVLRRLRGLP